MNAPQTHASRPSPLLLAAPLIDREQSIQRARIQALQAKRGRPPRLAVVIVGDPGSSDPASEVYVASKKKKGLALGIEVELFRASPQQTAEDFLAFIQNLAAARPRWDGILIQRPIPRFLNRALTDIELATLVPPSQDVDGFHPENQGAVAMGMLGPNTHVPCTPLGVLRLLEYYANSTVHPTPILPALSGLTAVVVGRSHIVGRPLAGLLLAQDCTVIQVHSKTPEPARFFRQADLVVVAAGKRHLFQARDFAPQSVVMDVGIHRTENGITGDVDFSGAAGYLRAWTPCSRQRGAHDHSLPF